MLSSGAPNAKYSPGTEIVVTRAGLLYGKVSF